MRKEFAEVKTRKEAVLLCPWASIIKKACGGYLCFESISDYDTHNRQK